MEHVRHSLLDYDFFLEHVKTEVLLTEDRECMKFLLEAEQYKNFGGQLIPEPTKTTSFWRPFMKKKNRNLPGRNQENVQVIDLII